MGNSDSTNDAAKSGAGGSGGAVYLKASDLVINSGVSIRADGGPGAPLATGGNTGATDSGGTGSAAGGGGRVYLEGTHSFVNHGSLSNDNISANKGGEAKGISFPSGINGLELWLDAADSSTLFSDHTFNTSATTDIGGWKDKSGNNNHATQATSSRKPTYTVSNSLLNNKSSVSSSSENGSIGLDLPSTSLQEIFVVAYYKDGSDNSFDNYNTLISGTGTNGQYRIMGHSGSSNWFTGSDRLNDGGNFKNGATSSSNSALPMSATLLRFASSVARTQTRGILYNTQNADRGWIGGVGQIIGLSSTSSTNDRQKIENYLAVKWGLSTSTRLGEDGTVRVVRPQVSSLEFTSGTLTIDTDKGEIAHSDGSFLLGEFTDKTFTAEDGTAYSYKISTFTADKISLGSGVVVNLMGNNPVSLRTRNNGDITLGSTINVNGGSDPSNVGGTAKAGGFNGGAKDVDGYGPGKGKTKSVSSQGGGAAYGGSGLENATGYSQTYGSPDLANHLLGGSGGGGGDTYGGGAGGGAVELFAHGDGVLTITSGGKILANGGDTSTQHSQSGGAGSGGAIRLEGGSISIAGTLEAKGGNGLTATPGGGGRIAIKTNGNLTLGTIALDGHTPGTLHISGATATSAINLSSGTLTFDSTHGYWHHTSGVHGTGVIEQKVDNAITYKTSTFTFRFDQFGIRTDRKTAGRKLPDS